MAKWHSIITSDYDVSTGTRVFRCKDMPDFIWRGEVTTTAQKDAFVTEINNYLVLGGVFTFFPGVDIRLRKIDCRYFRENGNVWVDMVVHGKPLVPEKKRIPNIDRLIDQKVTKSLRRGNA